MPFWKKAYQKKQGVYYPQAIVQGKPVETETIAKDLAKISTVSNSDVQAVLGDISGVKIEFSGCHNSLNFLQVFCRWWASVLFRRYPDCAKKLFFLSNIALEKERKDVVNYHK